MAALKQRLPRSLLGCVFLCLTMSACTLAPKPVAQELESTKVQPCEAECDEDNSARYRYYLGVLSVLVLG